MTFSDYMDYLRGKRIGVIGFGVSNQPLVRVLLRNGCDVTVCDRRDRAQLGATGDAAAAQGAKFILGADYLEHLDFDVIFRTPGVLPIVPQLRAAAQSGAILTSEMEAFCNLCPCRIIAITGSDGKTTTSTITAELLRAQGYTVHLGGNIGTPLFDRIPEIRPEDFAVLELSSFQLHSMHCAPDVAIITNISPNHLDVHPDFEDYVSAKCSIYRGQRPDGCLVLNAKDAHTPRFAAEAPGRVRYFSSIGPVENGVYCTGGVIYRAHDGKAEKILDAATGLLDTQTFADISLAEIAAAAGVSKGTLYYYYKNKTDILFDITNRYLDRQWDELIAWTENKDKDTSVHRLVKYVVERNTASAGMRLHLIHAAMLGDEALRAKLIDRYAAFERLIAEKIAERTDVVSADYLTQLILLASDGMIVQEALRNDNFDAAAFVRQSEAYLRVLRPADRI